jgi:CheY-like chemotaxis protein/anti-sigma regulatory factor (Ser/Thr protein kinase)
MSHELRTPLSAILGFAQLMETASPPPTAPQKRSIGQILKAGWYLLELINEILDLALIESGKLSLSMEPISLAEVMLECQTMIEPQAQKRGLSVTFSRFEIPCFVKADRTRLKQIFINLLSNAIKYNKVGGAVVVQHLMSTAGRIRIRVEDSGQGLSTDKLAQLFQPFNRLGQEASGEEGTGIGLVTTKRLVELMDGAIGVESTVGVGSVFWIELNITTEPQPAAGTAESTAVARVQDQGAAPSRVLLYVEDNPANLMLVEDLIARRPDICMLSAADGSSGIEIARAARPDVILMDINLPGISGTQALRILAEDPATAHIPVIALSANAVPRDIVKGLEAGFFRYLTKPIRVDEFMDALDGAMKLAQVAVRRHTDEAE